MGCGKVILFGEHAVVHGQPALAAALEIGVSATRLDNAVTVPCFCVPAWNITTYQNDGTRLGEAFAAIVACVERTGRNVPNVLFELRLDLPVGAGLGSSAALAVALTRALIEASSPAALPTDTQALVLEAAAASEMVFHGNPSGVDHTTSALGGIIRFQRDVSPAFETIAAEPLPIVIAQMEPGADTGAMVASVQTLLDHEPEVGAQLLRWMGELTRKADSALRQGDRQKIGRLMNLAHGALVALGVSTAALDRGCHMARQAGAFGAKLTGAGGGGCLVAVAPDDASQQVAAALTDAGALAVFITRAGVRSEASSTTKTYNRGE